MTPDDDAQAGAVPPAHDAGIFLERHSSPADAVESRPDAVVRAAREGSGGRAVSPACRACGGQARPLRVVRRDRLPDGSGDPVDLGDGRDHHRGVRPLGEHALLGLQHAGARALRVDLALRARESLRRALDRRHEVASAVDEHGVQRRLRPQLGKALVEVRRQLHDRGDLGFERIGDNTLILELRKELRPVCEQSAPDDEGSCDEEPERAPGAGRHFRNPSVAASRSTLLRCPRLEVVDLDRRSCCDELACAQLGFEHRRPRDLRGMLALQVVRAHLRRGDPESRRADDGERRDPHEPDTPAGRGRRSLSASCPRWGCGGKRVEHRIGHSPDSGVSWGLSERIWLTRAKCGIQARPMRRMHAVRLSRQAPPSQAPRVPTSGRHRCSPRSRARCRRSRATTCAAREARSLRARR